jgi:hypothetical protein
VLGLLRWKIYSIPQPFYLPALAHLIFFIVGCKFILDLYVETS